MYLIVPPGGCFPETRRFELGPEALTIGRAEACDIRVDVPGVDQEHAKISEVALIAMGPDCAVGDVPLDAGHRRLVMPGDEIQIGSIVVALEGSDPSLLPPPPPTFDDDGVQQNTQRLVGVMLEVPRVRVVEGANFGDELLLAEENREYVIGRGPKSDLVLDDREVSREHVKLLRKGFTILIQDQSSTRGSWLGRSAVYQGSTIEWARPRMLKVGATVLSLELPEAVRRAAPSAQASAPMTPPPRSRKGGMTPSGPPVAPASDAGAVPMGAANGPDPTRATQKLPPFGSMDPTPLPSMVMGHGHSQPPGMVPPGVPAGMGAVGGAGGVMARMPSAPPPNAVMRPRKAWKKSAPVIGRASGLLLLALAGLAIAGALFVVFSLLE